MQLAEIMRGSRYVVVSFYLIFGCGNAIGQLALVDQSWSSSGEPFASRGNYSTQQFDHPLPPDVNRSQVWDNFVLTGPASIDSLQWWGGYDRPFNANPNYRGLSDFFIQIHAAVPDPSGLSRIGKQLFNTRLTGGKAGIDEPTDQFRTYLLPDTVGSGSGESFRYEAAQLPEPIRLFAGEYWLSIVSAQTFPSPDPLLYPDDPDSYYDPNWAWYFGRDGDGKSYLQDFLSGNERVRYPRDYAVTLFAEQVPLVGDFTNDGMLSADDIDLWSARYRALEFSSALDFDLDGVLTMLDHAAWIERAARTKPGDADLNHRVEFVDFLKLSANYGQAGGWESGDFNADGGVSFPDFLLLSANFGYAAPPPLAPVPEPVFGSWWLLLAPLGARRQRR